MYTPLELKSCFMTFPYFMLGERMCTCHFPCFEVRGQSDMFKTLFFFLIQCESWKPNLVLHTWQQVSLLDEPSCRPTCLFLGSSDLGEMQEWVREWGEVYMFLIASRDGVVAAPLTLILSCQEYFYFLLMLVTLGSVCFCAFSEFFSFIITRIKAPDGSRLDSSQYRRLPPNTPMVNWIKHLENFNFFHQESTVFQPMFIQQVCHACHRFPDSRLEKFLRRTL